MKPARKAVDTKLAITRSINRRIPSENTEHPEFIFELPLGDSRIKIANVNPSHSSLAQGQQQTVKLQFSHPQPPKLQGSQRIVRINLRMPENRRTLEISEMCDVFRLVLCLNWATTRPIRFGKQGQPTLDRSSIYIYFGSAVII